MFVRIYVGWSVLIALAVAAPTWEHRSAEHDRRARRAGIDRSVLLQTPSATMGEIEKTVNPLIDAAGLEPYPKYCLAKQVIRLRKVLNLPTSPPRQVREPRGEAPTRPPKMAEEIIAFLKQQFDENHKQRAREVVIKVQSRFGREAVKPTQVTSWWNYSLHKLYYTPVHKPVRRRNNGADPPVLAALLPADTDMRDWGNELDGLLTPPLDSTSSAVSN